MKKKWKLVLCLLLAVILVAGGVTLWLVNRTPPDTDPGAPFVDLSDREKEKVLGAISNYMIPAQYHWYGQIDQIDLNYGVRYYGTFGGYCIVSFPYGQNLGDTLFQKSIAGYHFEHIVGFILFAYKNGEVVEVEYAYENGLLSKEQIGKIHQCYERYNQEVYVREEWIKYEKNKKAMSAVYVCGAAFVLGCIEIGIHCLRRRCGKRREENLL